MWVKNFPIIDKFLSQAMPKPQLLFENATLYEYHLFMIAQMRSSLFTRFNRINENFSFIMTSSYDDAILRKTKFYYSFEAKYIKKLKY